ncbi:geranylgeranylglycerol-phosphate geranylgeranyltransferase [Bacteroidota bacterium]
MMRTIGKYIKAYFSLFRIINLIIIALTQILVRYCIIENFYSFQDIGLQLSFNNFILLLLASVLIAAGGNIINDIYDVDIDRINKRKNVVKSIVPISIAWILYYVFNITGVIMGFALASKVGSYQLGFIFPVIAGLLYFYTTRYKGMLFWGNLIIAFLSAFVLLVVWLFEYITLRNDPDIYVLAFKGIPVINLYIWGYALFAFLCTILREWVKDLQDIPGDKRYGCNTLPIAIGIKRTQNLAIVVNILIIVLLALFQYHLLSKGYLFTFIYILVAVQSLLIYCLFLLFRMKTEKDYDLVSRLAKLIMLAGVLSMELLFIEN